MTVLGRPSKGGANELLNGGGSKRGVKEGRAGTALLVGEGTRRRSR